MEKKHDLSLNDSSTRKFAVIVTIEQNNDETFKKNESQLMRDNVKNVHQPTSFTNSKNVL